jgi:hypothetical protein
MIYSAVGDHFTIVPSSQTMLPRFSAPSIPLLVFYLVLMSAMTAMPPTQLYQSDDFSI